MFLLSPFSMEALSNRHTANDDSRNLGMNFMSRILTRFAWWRSTIISLWQHLQLRLRLGREPEGVDQHRHADEQRNQPNRACRASLETVGQPCETGYQCKSHRNVDEPSQLDAAQPLGGLD